MFCNIECDNAMAQLEAEIESQLKVDRMFCEYLFMIGFSVLPSIDEKNDLCSVLERLYPVKMPGDISLAVVGYLEANFYDIDLWVAIHVESESEMHDLVQSFRDEHGAPPDRVILHVTSLLRNQNITVHSPIGYMEEYPLNGPRFNETVSISRHKGLYYAILGEADGVPVRDSFSETDNEFRERLNNEGFRIVNIPADGDCLFHALAYYNNGKPEKHPEVVRREISDYIRQHINEDDFQILFVNYTEGAQETFINSMEGNAWGNYNVIYTAMKLYQVNIVLHMPDSAIQRFPEEQDLGVYTLHLSYHNGNHYNVVVRNTPGSSGLRSHDSSTCGPSTCGPPSLPIPKKSKDQVSKNKKPTFSGGVPLTIDCYDMEGRKKSCHSIEDRFKGDVGCANSAMLTLDRHQLDIYIIVYGVWPENNLPDALTIRHPGSIYIMHDFKQKDIGEELLNDEELSRHTSVWRLRYDLPKQLDRRNRYVWISRLVLVPLILTISRFRWNDFNIRTMFKREPNALTMIMLEKFWGIAEEAISQDVLDMNENRQQLFCFNCKDNCRFRQNPWHLNLSRFEKMEFNEPATGSFFWKRYSYVDLKSKSDAPLFIKLRAIYDKRGSFQDVLDLIQEHFRNVQGNPSESS